MWGCCQCADSIRLCYPPCSCSCCRLGDWIWCHECVLWRLPLPATMPTNMSQPQSGDCALGRAMDHESRSLSHSHANGIVGLLHFAPVLSLTGDWSQTSEFIKCYLCVPQGYACSLLNVLLNAVHASVNIEQRLMHPGDPGVTGVSHSHSTIRPANALSRQAGIGITHYQLRIVCVHIGVAKIVNVVKLRQRCLYTVCLDVI